MKPLPSFARAVLQPRVVCRAIASLLFCLTVVAVARGEISPDFEYELEPEVHVEETVRVFSTRLKPLWLQALARPEVDYQRMAAEAIGRAHAAGAPGMEETVPALVAILTAPAAHPVARLAAAPALVALDARQAAPQMATSALKYGADLRQIIEPALADWNYEPARARWRARLSDAQVRHRDLILAIYALKTARDKTAVSRLIEIVHDGRRPADVRLAAAAAAGALQNSGLEADARRLSAAGAAESLVNRLCAVRLLTGHGDHEAQELLAELAIDPEAAVAVVALRRLIDIDPQLAIPLAGRALESYDSEVRRWGAETYARLPDPPRVAALARLLNDPHPMVRRHVRDSLCTLAARPELDRAVRGEAMAVLAGDRWRGLEQAAILLGALNHQPAGARLVELLDFDRLEVGVAAAWGLKKLAIPALLPAMLDKAARNAEVLKVTPSHPRLDDQTAHLFEVFGRMQYAPAETLLREHIPKNLRLGLRPRSRASAIWSLGLLHAENADEALAAALMERIADDGGPSDPPELAPVKQAAAVTIVRMKSASIAVPMRKYYESKEQSDRVLAALRWAIAELTGEQVPELAPPVKHMLDWFLVPLDN